MIQRIPKMIRWVPVALLLVIAACRKDNNPGSGPTAIKTPPLKVYLDDDANYSDFDTLLKQTGFYQRLAQTDSNFTVFIPDNAAFDGAGIRIDSLLSLPAATLWMFVGCHILPGAYTTNAIPQTINTPDTSLAGVIVYLSKPVIPSTQTYQPTILQDQKTLQVNGVSLKSVDVLASNGVIDVLEQPLTLPHPSVQAYLQGNPRYSLLVQAFKKFGLFALLDSAGPYTVFAPDNDAFLSNGIDSTQIASDTFDLNHYHPFLFSSSIVPGRIFQQNFFDAPEANQPDGVAATVYNTWGKLEFQGSYYDSYFYPSAYDYISTGYFVVDTYSIGPTSSQYVEVDVPALNGVVHGLNNILVYPDSMYIRQ